MTFNFCVRLSATTESPDQPLLAYDDAVDRALDRAKAWSKYAKDVSSYVEKRASMETEFAKSIAKLANTVQQSLGEDSNLPFQSILSTALDLDAEYAHKCQSTQHLIQTHKFVEPLNARRNDHDKTRKNLKDMWTKENRRMVRISTTTTACLAKPRIHVMMSVCHSRTMRSST